MRGFIIGSLLVALAALTGCRGEQSVASQSAAAFREAQKKGETFGGGGHGHGHGAATPGAADSEPDAPDAAGPEEHPAGHGHGAAEPSASGEGHQGQGHEAHAGGHPLGRTGGRTGHEAHGAAGTQQGGDHSAMGHGRSTAPSEGAGQHAGHGTASQQPSVQGGQTPGAGHAGHSPSQGETPSVASAPAPVAVPPEQPARTLQPDALDAPAATSVMDAQRSAEMARGMAGGHGAHGVGRYRHIDAGRGPEAYLEEDQPPGAGSGSQQHDHGVEHDHKPPSGATGDGAQERRKG